MRQGKVDSHRGTCKHGQGVCGAEYEDKSAPDFHLRKHRCSGQEDRQEGRWTDRKQIDRKADRWTEIQMDRQTDRLAVRQEDSRVVSWTDTDG